MNLSSINLSFFANIAPLVAGLNKAERALDKAGRQMQATGKKLTFQLTAPITALGAVAVNTFQAFEQQMAELKAVSGASAEELKRLSDNAKELGGTTIFTAKEVGALQTEFARLGFSAAEIEKVTEATLYLAQASGEDLARSAEIAGATIRAFGLDASQTTHVADVMAESFNKSALDLSTFADSMKYVAPVAAAAGISLEETSAMLAVLSNAGIKGSMAGTALRKIIGDLAGGSQPLTEKLKQLAASGMTFSDANEEVGRTAQSALLVLSKGAGQIDPLTESFKNADGAAKSMAETMGATAQGAFKNLESAFEAVMISAGELIATALVPLVNKITDLLLLINSAPGPIKVLAVVIAGLVAAVGPLLFTFGLLQRNFIAMLPYLTKIGTALRFIAVQGLRMLIGPIGVVIAAMAALGAIAIYVGYNFEAFKAMALNAVKMFVNLSIGYLNKWIGVFNAIADTLGMDSIKIQLFDKLELEAVPKLKSISQVAKEVKRDVAAMFGTGTGSPASDPQVAAEGFAEANLQAAGSMNVAKKSAEELKKEAEELRKKYEGFNQMLENQMSLMKQYASETQREVEDQLRTDIQFLPTMEPVDMDDIVEPEVFTKLPKNFAQLSLAAQEMSKNISDSITSAATSFAIGIGEMLGSALAGGEGFKNFGQFALMTLAGLLQQVGEMAVQTGIALMGIKVALKTLNPAVAIAGGIALIALASGIKTSLAKRAESIQGGGGIPMLAEGGIATGPTLAMIGEGRGPEAVIPLDKLEGMLSGGFGGQNVVVTGRIQGSDILISSERAQRERSRYRGF
jgi:phage-related minor tail protein